MKADICKTVKTILENSVFIKIILLVSIYGLIFNELINIFK